MVPAFFVIIAFLSAVLFVYRGLLDMIYQNI